LRHSTNDSSDFCKLISKYSFFFSNNSHFSVSYRFFDTYLFFKFFISVFNKSFSSCM
jgi:hypothetical protein